MTKFIKFYLDNFHTFGQILLNKIKITLSMFIKLKSIFSRMIILNMFEQILKIGWHLHSLKTDFAKWPQDRFIYFRCIKILSLLFSYSLTNILWYKIWLDLSLHSIYIIILNVCFLSFSLFVCLFVCLSGQYNFSPGRF